MTQPPQAPDLTEREKQIVAWLRAEAVRRLESTVGPNGRFVHRFEYWRGDGINQAADAIECGEAFR